MPLLLRSIEKQLQASGLQTSASMGDQEARNHSPPGAQHLGGSSGSPESRFLAIGTFGHHGQSQEGSDHALGSGSGSSSGSGDSNEEEGIMTLECILEALKEECQHIAKADEALTEEKPLTNKELELQKQLISMSLEECLRMSSTTHVSTHYCSYQERQSWTELAKLARSGEKERYLCISDGLMICCLDLKSKDETLPTTCTLDILEKGLPTSMGLFKLGSGAYMIGGQEFSKFDKLQYRKEVCTYLRWFYKTYGFKGTSRETYHLSGGDGGLSLSKCDSIPPLKKPKFWPIVVRIGDEMHVIESIPDMYLDPPRHILPSHEVLNLKEVGLGWTEVPPLHDPKNIRKGLLIVNHLVVGDQIYVKIDCRKECYVFDTKSRKWEDLGDRSRTKHVGSLLYGGKAICSGRVLSEVSTDDHPLYFVVRIGRAVLEYRSFTIASSAHLVDKQGEIVCTWELPNLLEGLKMHGILMREATLFRVEDYPDQSLVSLCAVVTAVVRETADYFLCVSSFTVDQEVGTPSPNSLLSPHALSSSSDDSDDSCAAQFEQKYHGLRPKVVVERSRVYHLPSRDLHFPPKLSACFL